MAVIGNAPFQGLVSGGNILDASIEGVDLSTSAIAARLGYTPVDPGAAAITGGTINGTTIGATTASTGAFTNLSASGTLGVTGVATLASGAILNTPASVTLTNATGLPVATGVSGLGTGIATALAANVGSAGAPVVNGGVLGTPASGTVTNLTGTASININGTVGATTANTGAFTTLSASGAVTLSGGTANGITYLNGSKVVTTGSALSFDGSTLSINNGVTSASISLIGTYVGSGTVAFLNFQRLGGAVAGTLGYDDSINSIRFGTTTNHSTIFLQNNAEAMRLNNTGLGIGMSAANKFDVYQTNTGLGAGRIWHVNGNSINVQPSYNYYAAYNHIFQSLNSTTEYARFLDNGSLVIGNTQNYIGAKLYVENSINVNYSGEIAMRYNNSDPAENTGYWKGMTGTAPGTGGTARGLHIFNYDKDSDDGITFWTGRPGSATRLMKILPNGNVGIGTNGPSSKLHINTNNADPFNTVDTVLTLTQGGGNAGSGTQINFQQGSGTNWIRSLVTGGNSTTGSALVFGTAATGVVGTEAMRITSAGNLAVGTTLNSGYRGIFTSTSGGSVTNVFAVHNGSNHASTGTGARLLFKLSNFEDAIEQNKYASIEAVGTSAYNEDTTLIFRTQRTGNRGNLPEERMRITHGGNVGIGSNDPQAKLHVNAGSGAISIRDYKSIVYNLDASILESQTYQRFSIGINTTNTTYPRTAAYVKVTVVPNPDGGIGLVHSSVAEFSIWRIDGNNNADFKITSVDNGTIGIATPVASNNTILFGFTMPNNGTGSTPTFTIKIEIIARDVDNYVVTPITGAVAHTGANLLNRKIITSSATAVLIGSTTIEGQTLKVGNAGGGDTILGITAGAASTSSLWFGDSDANVGYILYNHASNYMAFRANGGTESMRISSGGNLGINNNNPSVKLTIGKTTTAYEDIYGITAYANTSDFMAGIGFDQTDDTLIIRNDQSFTSGGIGFRAGGTTNHLFIKTGGNVGVGTNSPNGKLEIAGGADAQHIRIGDNNHDASASTFRYPALSYYARRDNNRYNGAPLSDYGSTASIVFTDRPGTSGYPNFCRTSDIEFWTATNTGGTGLDPRPTKRVSITAEGVVDLAFGHIKFPATQNASGDANTLDDYEEGTWTPVIAGTTGGTYYNQVGRYTKVGRVVTCDFFIQTGSFTYTNSSAALTITGLPFVPSGFAYTGPTGSMYSQAMNFNNTESAAVNFVTPTATTSSTILLRTSGTGSSAGNVRNENNGNFILTGQVIYSV